MNSSITVLIWPHQSRVVDDHLAVDHLHAHTLWGFRLGALVVSEKFSIPSSLRGVGGLSRLFL